MKIALYARVSTAGGRQDTEMQLRELREHASARGWTVTGEYVDHMSGSKENRPQLNKLMRDAHARKFDAVACWKLDRFGRSLRHLINTLAEFDALGIAFVSLRDSFDLTTPAGRAMFGMIGVMAEFERSLIVERVRAGMKNAKAKGIAVGRPTKVLDMALVTARRAKGESLRAIASDMGCSAATLCERLA